MGYAEVGDGGRVWPSARGDGEVCWVWSLRSGLVGWLVLRLSVYWIVVKGRWLIEEDSSGIFNYSSKPILVDGVQTSS